MRCSLPIWILVAVTTHYCEYTLGWVNTMSIYVHRPASASMTCHMVGSDENASLAAEVLRERAAKLRIEIAALEGKTVEQVEMEAREKRDAQTRTLQARNEARKASNPFDWGKTLEVPSTREEMITQAARAIQRAYTDGINRQTVRLALVSEGQSMQESNQWPGGAQQMSREAAQPLTRELLQELRVADDQLFPPERIRQQDIWDFDGSALLASEAKEGPKFDVQALVMPNTDVKYINDIEKIDKAMGDRLFLLVNPFWRNIDTWGINILAPGAKQKAKQVIFDKGYEETYVFLRFSVRGEECVAIRAYPYNWQIFAYLEDETGWERPVRLGSSQSEPKTTYITELINKRSEFKLSKTMRRFSR